ncbi:MAG TPA: hypothetical protein VFA15_00225 [Nitrososphaera sp.]|nr:hypothetical protein [Nitrososphaera sp.]
MSEPTRNAALKVKELRDAIIMELGFEQWADNDFTEKVLSNYVLAAAVMLRDRDKP